MEHQFSRRQDVIWSIALAILITALFLATLRTDVGGTEDSPKFQFLGQVLGTAHSPGYPLYTIATYVFTRVPLGTLAYRVNLFSAAAGVLSCLCIFWMSRRLGVSRLLSAAAALAAATSFPVWSNSIVAEVYTLAALMSALAILWLMVWGATGQRAWLWAACAIFAAGLGNHLTIVAVLPAALIYGIVKDRTVLRPRVIGIAAIIGVVGVAQYGFIALRTLQRAPYLEARATTLQGLFDVITAKDASWARFSQSADQVVGVEALMLLEGLRVHMGTLTVALVLLALVVAVVRKQSEVLLIAGAAAGTLALVANLRGDVVGFITPVIVLLWPLAALGLQTAVSALFNRESVITAAGAVAMLLPVTNIVRVHPAIEVITQPGDVPALRALYGRLPAGSALVAENYFIARVLNYLHFSNEYEPDPNPRLLENDAAQVRAAAAEGQPVYALDGAITWLTSQGLIFEPTSLSRQPFARWLAQQPTGTMVVVAAAGRVLPVDWLPNGPRVTAERPANFSALAWTKGTSAPQLEYSDSSVVLSRPFGPEGRLLTATAGDEGPRILWGDDVLSAMDRGLSVVVIAPSGRIAANWTFAPTERFEATAPPAAWVHRGERPCAILRLGQRTDVSTVLADGGWLATFEGSGQAAITLDGGPGVGWRHSVWNGRGQAAIDSGLRRLRLDGAGSARTVFSLSMALPSSVVTAVLESGDVTSARVCQVAIPEWPATGALDVSGAAEAMFGDGWHAAEHNGPQVYRWSARRSTIRWRMAKPAEVRLILRMRAANAAGATVRASVNGGEVATCALPAGGWTDCPFTVPSAILREGANELVVSSNTLAPADRASDTRELAFVMQAGRVRVGRE